MDKWDPEDYYKHSYPQYAFALGLVGRLALRGDERILDISCGDAKITALQAADLIETLIVSRPFTAFAPTGNAFLRLPIGAVDKLVRHKAAMFP